MKRFTKMLALGMAVALTLGMTVSASGNDPANPSTVTRPSVEGSEGIIVGETDVEAVFNASKKAVEEDGALDSLSAGKTMDTFEFVDAFDLTVTKEGTVTVTTTEKGGRDKDYGYSWGYVLLHFNNEMTTVKEVIKLDKNGNDYSAKVKSGSPFALVLWKLKYSNAGSTHYLNVNKGWARATYQDEHTAARTAIEVKGQGTIAASYYNSQYVFAKTMGSIVMNLAEDSNVQFSNLDNLEKDEAYVVLCYNDVQNISGAPNRHFLMTNKVADGAYTVDLPKGEYAVVVIKVTTDTTKVPATPVPAPEASAPGIANGGAQTGGVVSPKTGEMLPFAVILAAICLAGAAVCAKKARTNA